MAEVWPLPDYDLLKNMGHEWLLHLLASCPEEQRAPLLMTLWRIWHAHNEMTHGKPCPSIEGSRRFFISYLKTLALIKQYPEGDIVKGKMVMEEYQVPKKRDTMAAAGSGIRRAWQPPGHGTGKLNVDGAYKDGVAGAGMVLRDENGVVIFSACRALDNCRDAVDAELAAIVEGLKLALHWSNLHFTIETDCAEVAALIMEQTPNTSVFAFTISTVRELLRERESSLVMISREVNGLAHELAKIGRVQRTTEFWLSGFPQEVSEVVASDCNFVPN
jgi:hypothetical protein